MARSLTLDWYEITNPSPGVFAIFEPLQIDEVLSYLIVGGERALLIGGALDITDSPGAAGSGSDSGGRSPGTRVRLTAPVAPSAAAPLPGNPRKHR